MWPFKKKPIKEIITYPVYLHSHNKIHYIIVYSEHEGYHFSLSSQMNGSITAYLTQMPLLFQYTHSDLYHTITEDEFIEALDNCKYIPKKEKLYILTKK